MSVIRSLVDAIDGVSSSKMFGKSQPVADHRAEILREKYSSRFEVAENEDASPLTSFFKNVVNKPARVEESVPIKVSLIEGLGSSSLYEPIEVRTPSPSRYREAPIVVGTNDEKCIESIREDLSSGSIHESTLHDYVKMAYLYRRRLLSVNNDKEI